MLEVKIDALPEEVTPYQAIEHAYLSQIAFTWARLSEGCSTVVRCDKQIIPYLQRILKRKLAQDGIDVVVVDGRDEPGAESRATRIQNIVHHLRTLLHHTAPRTVVMLPYLDVITSTSGSGLSTDSKEVMTLIHENPLLVMAAFEDPAFPLPELIARAFAARTEMLGISRAHFAKLITRGQARKFGRGTLGLMPLYKYVSGLNPIGLREVLATFEKKADHDPADARARDAYLRELRTYTSAGGTNLSAVRLDEDIAGYVPVKARIRKQLLNLLERTLQLSDEESVRAIESLVPRGIIFHGPPGTGKTLFAQGIAEAIQAAMYLVSGPEMKSMWIGEGEANIRRLFARARSTAPSVIVFDELDSIAAARHGGARSDGGAAHAMVNQLLTEMDGFRKEELVFVIGTTNFLASLDAAFLRPGRFELQIEIDYPDWEDRLAILSLYDRKLGLGLDPEDLERLASFTSRPAESGTPHTGDHLCALMRDLKRHLISEELPHLRGDALIAWLKGRSQCHVLEAEEERVVAVHEAGHALMMAHYERTQDIHRITIESGIPQALGMVEIQRKRRVQVFTERAMRAEIGIALGGHAAERLVFSEISSGAANDLAHATAIAEEMVAAFGMGPSALPRSYTDRDGAINPLFSTLISGRVDALLIEVMDEVARHLTARRAMLDRLVACLLEQRTLEPEAVRRFFADGGASESR